MPATPLISRLRRRRPARGRTLPLAPRGGAWTAAVLVVVLVAGCAALAEPPEAQPMPEVPAWSVEDVRDHLHLFNASVAERATGTPGYAQAAAYVAARMREAGLQPAFGEDFRVLYRTPINHPAASSMASVGADTLAFVAGTDHLPDARSDSGAVRTAEVFVDPFSTGAGALTGRVVFTPAAEATTAYLERVRAEGARAVVLVGPLRPRQAARPVAGLLVVQATFDAAARLLGRPTVFSPDARGAGVLGRTLELRVVGRYEPLSTGINTLGYVSGTHPVRARELVLVCADLDGAPGFAAARTLDFEHFGQGAAALLEAAARTTFFAARTSVPERSMLFAVWSGGRLGGVGLQAYLRQPLWPLEATRAVVYVGLSPDEEPAVRSMLAAYGLPLVVVPPPPPVAEQPVALFPQRPRRADGRLRRGDGTPGVNLSAVIEAAAAEALRLAQAAVETSLPLTLGTAPYAPVVEETLPRPTGG